MTFRAYVTKGISVNWLAPVVGVSLREGRIDYDHRVFGAALSGDRFLLWATEEVIEKAVRSSPKNAYAKLANEARKEGEDIPLLLASVSGCSSENGVWSDTEIGIDAATSKPKVADDRTVGLISDGVGATPKKIKAKPLPLNNEVTSEA